ncbi:membrane protein insertion efficiency factor YidD [Demequina subtropica]|uniref:membrane protein insertion efficiency factor YidD n=1 Tax=Demequina subtropica TaxID=1638989 RepID=UPI0007859749|nr:membrane protein insertion efficiency factor YidD [Demequina subtropica]
MSIAGKALTGAIRGYQLAISPLTGPRCKYHPTCSHFAIEAIQVHGAVVGTGLAGWRLLRCNPWSHGGVDDVPAKGERLFRMTRNNAAMLPDPTPARPI